MVSVAGEKARAVGPITTVKPVAFAHSSQGGNKLISTNDMSHLVIFIAVLLIYYINDASNAILFPEVRNLLQRQRLEWNTRAQADPAQGCGIAHNGTANPFVPDFTQFTVPATGVDESSPN